MIFFAKLMIILHTNTVEILRSTKLTSLELLRKDYDAKKNNCESLLGFPMVPMIPKRVFG